MTDEQIEKDDDVLIINNKSKKIYLYFELTNKKYSNDYFFKIYQKSM